MTHRLYVKTTITDDAGRPAMLPVFSVAAARQTGGDLIPPGPMTFEAGPGEGMWTQPADGALPPWWSMEDEERGRQ